ncbi:hypothetical protein ACFQV8_23870 [Pseudonocardia benzenivorans]
MTVADAHFDVGAARLRCWVGDELRQDEAVADMIFSPRRSSRTSPAD